MHGLKWPINSTRIVRLRVFRESLACGRTIRLTSSIVHFSSSSSSVFITLPARVAPLIIADVVIADGVLPFGVSKHIGIGLAPVRAARVTYVGELGWELYVPNEFALAVYQQLFEASATLGESHSGDGGSVLRDAGYYAIDSLRIEKAYRCANTCTDNS